MKYKVLSNLLTGAGLFVAGDEIELAETEETKSLIADGVLGEIKDTADEIPPSEDSDQATGEEVAKPKKRGRKKK